MSQVFVREHLQAVVFDFDGTLAEPTLDFTLMRERAMEALAPYASLPVSAKEPVMEELARVCATLDAPTAAKARAATMAAIEKMEVAAAYDSALYPFVRPMLAAFAEQGIQFAIITRNCPAAVRTVFPDVDTQCLCLLTRDDVTHVKPHPEHLEKALAILGCKPEHALMVGDHPMDIQVGKNVGTMTAGVTSGGIPRERLAVESPTFLADDVGKLMAHLGIMPE